MTREEVAKAIKEDQVVRYNGARYQVVGYKLIKNLKGEKEYYIGLLDLKNQRTYIWIGINDI